MTKLNEQPPYSPDLVPNDYYVSLQKLEAIRKKFFIYFLFKLCDRIF